MIDINISLIFAIIATVVGAVGTFLVGRIASKRVEERIEKVRVLRERVVILEVIKKKSEKLIASYLSIIQSLRSQQDEKDKQIAEMKEQISVFARTSGDIKDELAAMVNLIDKMSPLIEKLVRQEQERSKKRKAKEAKK